ncbi:phosphatidylglycerol lysyltransferase domain-containing protein [Thermoflavifilum thermophilum]|uniref:Phosphatidylglycerol lysyltransferase n=1 Tax=Thermoflavifilum thermophilum TaxID=1393122 RepID=A0A1I7MY77_9BACT|nr:phosphatidylglycerol lysyltransferase domain-containing protein [Thermoflavifilum thermophilum]SFV27350.1 phosphatidylglycerol lysyltransferase [Thermoflavifilum thermophilum]
MSAFEQIRKRLIKGTVYWREILSLFALLVGLYFFRRQQADMVLARELISSLSWPYWILLLLLFTGFVFLQSLNYRLSFAVMQSPVSWRLALDFFLKRSVVDIFLSPEHVIAERFFSIWRAKADVSHTKSRFSTYLFYFFQALAYVLIGLATLIWWALHQLVVYGKMLPAVGTGMLLLGLFFLFWRRPVWVYAVISRFFPELDITLQELAGNRINRQLIQPLMLFSLIAQWLVLLMLAAAIMAITGSGSASISWLDVFSAYALGMLFFLAMPFLKGMGLVELVMILLFLHRQFSLPEAAAIVFLFRLIQFWLPVLGGVFNFLFTPGSLLLRIYPAFLVFLLGLINLISGLSPAIHWRMRLISQYIPLSTIHASNDFVIVTGLMLLITSLYLLRGLRNAWIIAFTLGLLSCVAHLIKDIDYEEALFALFSVIVLWITRHEYRVKSNRKIVRVGVRMALVILVCSLIFGVMGFYFLNEKQFGINLNLWQSIRYTLQYFFLMNGDLQPHTRFASGFLRVINALGVGSIGLLLYGLLRPFVFQREEVESDLQRAHALVQQYGRSAIDYFKTYPDKLFYFASDGHGLVSYKVGNDFAIVLGEPVCAPDDAVEMRIIAEFEQFCEEQGLKVVYYRVDEERLPFFTQQQKKYLLIGQEAIVDALHFSMEGKARQNLRTARNTLLKKGYHIEVFSPPVPGNILQQLKAVSDDWLQKLHKQELVFSQGMFLEEEIREHTVLALMDAEQRIVAFLDLIPDYRPGEVRYDLIRKLADTPSTCMDFLMVGLIEYCQQHQIPYINMGMAPLSGIEEPKNIQELTIKMAYEKIRRFQHYRGLRFFKEKFDPVWENKYLIYQHHFDLLFIPAALNEVMKEF